MIGKAIKAAIVAGIALGLGIGSAQAQNTTIRLNSAGIAGELPLFLAQQERYYAAEKLEVKFLETAANSASDTMAMLSSGDIEMSVFALSAGWLNAVDRGLPIVSVMALNTLTPSDKAGGILVRKDHIDSGRFKTLADLKGMKVGVFSVGGTGHYTALKGANLGKDGANAIDFVALGPPDIMTALANKTLDAAFNVEPFIFFSQAKGIAQLVAGDGQLTPGLPTTVLSVNKGFLDRNRDAVTRFVRATLKAQRQYGDAVKSGNGLEPILKALQANGRMKDMGILSKMALPSADRNGKFDPAAFDALQQFFIDAGVMKQKVPIEKVFDFSILEKVAAN